jgi:hypothetical protein
MKYGAKMQSKKYHTVGAIPKSNITIKRCKINGANTQIHERSYSWIATDTSIKRCRVKLVYCAHKDTVG